MTAAHADQPSTALKVSALHVIFNVNFTQTV